MPKFSIALVQDSQTNGVTINSEDIYQNDIDPSIFILFSKRPLSNTSRFNVLSRKPVSFSTCQQNITSVGDIERNRQVVSFRLCQSSPNYLPVQVLTGQTTAVVADVVDNRFHMIVAEADISDAPVISYAARLSFVG